MSNIDQNEALKVLNAMFKGTAYTALATVYVALDTVAPASSSALGTEASTSGGSYARASLAAANVTVAAGSGGTAGLGVATTTAALNYTNMPGATYVAVEIFDSLTATTRRLWFGNLGSTKALAAGDTLTIAAGNLSASLG